MKSFPTYYLLAFIEGGLVMSEELITARLLAPFYGNSLYVLTSVLGITMIALLMGYFLGGRIVKSNSKNLSVLSFSAVLIVAIILSISPVISSGILKFTLNLGLIGGTLLGTALLLGIPLILCGMVSPMLIQLISESGKKAGEASGNVYAISTLGGVLLTFLVGLFFIPSIGVKMTAIWVGLSLGLLTLLLFYSNSNKRLSLIFSLLILSSGFLGSKGVYQPFPSYANCEYHTDGLLGRMDVCDFGKNFRVLSNNGTDQSKIKIVDGTSLMLYNHVVATVASLVPTKTRKNALVIGLAGGSLVKEIKELGFANITAVDIDKRTFEISTKYFGLNPYSFDFVEDDGRHFILTSDKTFDLIVIDASASEQQPYHLYTREAIEEYKNHLSEDGMVIFNIIDNIGEGKGIILDKIGDGMDYLNLSPRLLREFYPLDKMDNSQLSYWIHERILVGSRSGYLNLENKIEDLTDCCRGIPFCQAVKSDFISMSFKRENLTSKGFEDDKPEMEKLNFERIKKLRTIDFIY